MDGEPDRPIERLGILTGVREYSEGWDVELWRSERGRLLIRAYNEGHNNYVNIDLVDLIDGLSGSREGILDGIRERRAEPFTSDIRRN